jgi:hypothetical protein
VAITLTPDALARVAYAAYSGVYNKRNPYMVDRKAMPWLSFISKHEDTAPLAGADGVIVKQKINGGLDLEGWERKDNLHFAEQDFQLETKFPWSNIHMGSEVVHDDIEPMGFVVLPNQPRGKNFAKADSASDSYKLVDWMTHMIEDMMDSYDIKVDQLLLRDNSYNAKLPQGWDAFWPRGVCPGMVSDGAGVRGYYNLGSFGGKLRSAYPDALQHFVWLNATWGAAGSLRQALTVARREAELRSRGRSKGGIKYIMAGAGAIDRYVKFATLNNTNYTQAVTVLNNGGASRLDIGIPDTGLHFEGTPIIHNPTFEILDRIENPTYKWTNSMMLVDPDTVCLAYAPGKKKFFSAPMDEGDVRVTRLSLDSKLNLLPKIANGNAIVTLAES